MARRTTEIELQDREQTLRFRITEFSARQAERWLARIAFLLVGSGIQVPDGAGLQASAQHLMKTGLQSLSGLEYEKVEPLWNELLSCCERLTDNGVQKVTLDTLDGYIEDVSTLFKLKVEVLKHNFGFFAGASGLSFPPAGGAAA